MEYLDWQTDKHGSLKYVQLGSLSRETAIFASINLSDVLDRFMVAKITKRKTPMTGRYFDIFLVVWISYHMIAFDKTMLGQVEYELWSENIYFFILV